MLPARGSPGAWLVTLIIVRWCHGVATEATDGSKYQQRVDAEALRKCQVHAVVSNKSWSSLSSCRVPKNAPDTCCFVTVMTNASIVDGLDSRDPLCKLDGQLQYLQLYHCAGDFKWAVFAGMLAWMLVLFILLGSTADTFFCPAVEGISRVLHIPPRVAGITLLALGNGAPDIMSFLASVKAGEFEMAIGALTGAGIFVAVAIVGGVSLVCANGDAGELKARGMFFRDVLCLISGYALLLSIMLARRASTWQAVLFLVIYVMFVLMAIIGNFVPPLLKEDRESWRVARGIRSKSGSPRSSSMDESLIVDESKEVRQNSGTSSRRSHAEREAHDIFLPRFGEVHTTSNRLHITRNMASGLRGHSRSSANGSSSRTEESGVPLRNKWRTQSVSSGLSGMSSVNLHATSSRPSKQWHIYRFMKRLDNALETEEMGFVDKACAVVELPFTLLRAASIPVVVEESDSDDEGDSDEGGTVYSRDDGNEDVVGVTAWDTSFVRARMVCNPPFVLGFLTQQYLSDSAVAGIPLWQIVIVVTSPLCALVFHLTKTKPSGILSNIYLFVAFFAGLQWLGLVADELVSLLTSFGDILVINNAILGLTVLAIGNSLGDWAADTAVAKNGYPNMAMSACYGGPFFNLCIGMGIGLLQLTVKTGSYELPKLSPSLFVSTSMCMGGLFLTACFAFATGFRIPPWVGRLCILWYCAFCVAITVTIMSSA